MKSKSSAVLAAAMRPSFMAAPPSNVPTASFLRAAVSGYANKHVRLAVIIRSFGL